MKDSSPNHLFYKFALVDINNSAKKYTHLQGNVWKQIYLKTLLCPMIETDL